MAQAPTNPLAGIESQVRSLLSRGDTGSLGAAENLIRAFVGSVPSQAQARLAELQTQVGEKRTAARGRQRVQDIVGGASRRQAAEAARGREIRSQPLVLQEQQGPPALGVTPKPGEPGGRRLFTNPKGEQVASPIPVTEDELETFSESEIAELQEFLTTPQVKQLIERRDERVAQRQAENARTQGVTTMSPEARKKFEQRTGTLSANRAAPLGVNAIRWIDPVTLESALPGDSETKATADGKRPLQSNNPQFVSAARAAQNILREFDVLLPKLFDKDKNFRYSNVASIYTSFLLGDVDAAKFLSLKDSNRAIFARAGGDVANISVAEQEFQDAALPGAGDTFAQAQAKLILKKRLLRNVVLSALGLPLLDTAKEKKAIEKTSERRLGKSGFKILKME